MIEEQSAKSPEEQEEGTRGWLQHSLNGIEESQKHRPQNFSAKLSSVLWAQESRDVLSPLWRFDLHS